MNIENKPPLKYPRRWLQPTTKKEYRVMPWWEIPEPVLNEDEWENLTNLKVRAKYGVLVQIGFLIETEQDLFIGIGPQAEKLFEDLGEWEPAKKAEVK